MNGKRKKEKLIDILCRLTDDKTLDRLVRAGVIAPKTILYRDMYLKYESYLKQDMTLKESRHRVAGMFEKFDDRTVYRAIRVMNQMV